jgi:hypothetical protein
LGRASRLAAAIEQKFGVLPKLVGGHDAIFEVAVNNSVVYTNQKQCGQFPTHEQIFDEVRKYKDPIAVENQKEDFHEEVSISPCCPLPSEGGGNCCD